jgi:hypothetical protein
MMAEKTIASYCPFKAGYYAETKRKMLRRNNQMEGSRDVGWSGGGGGV